MDERLNIVQGERLHPLRSQDIPTLAQALIAHRHHTMHAVVGGVYYIVLSGHNVTITLLMSDWEKLFPFIESDYFEGVSYDGALAKLREIFDPR